MTGSPSLPPRFAALVASDRVSQRTRSALLDRARPDTAADDPAALPRACLDTLRALTGRILPQRAASGGIDIAQRLDAMLAQGIGDGWRFADLPPDREAYEAGLLALDEWAFTAHGAAFASLGAVLQDAMLTDLAAGHAPAGARLTPSQLARWFEDVRADATRIYVAHPATLARIGYGGFAFGGDGTRLPGFHALGPGERDPSDPEPGA